MKRAAVIAVAALALTLPVLAQAGSVLTGREARATIQKQDSRNTVKWCKRLDTTHIRCGVRTVLVSLEEPESGVVQDFYGVLIADVGRSGHIGWAFPGYAD